MVTKDLGLCHALEESCEDDPMSLNKNGGRTTKIMPDKSTAPKVILNKRILCPRNADAKIMVIRGLEKISVKASPRGMSNTQLKLQMIIRPPKRPCIMVIIVTLFELPLIWRKGCPFHNNTDAIIPT